MCIRDSATTRARRRASGSPITCDRRRNRLRIRREAPMTRLSPVLAVVATAALAARARGDTEPSTQDLQALDRQKQWVGLLDAADRVKPAARTADWARLITAAATHVAEQIERAGATGLRQAGSLISVVPIAEHKYAFLVSDAGYLGAKAKALQGVVTACERGAISGCGAVVASLADGVAKFPPGTAKAIALLVADDLAPADSVHSVSYTHLRAHE